MASPCRKCGATKTESIHHGLLYNLAKLLGYRLCQCSRCRRLRLFARGKSAASQTEGEAPTASPRSAAPAPAAAVEAEFGSKIRCPRCGKEDYRRSRRKWWEHLAGRQPMLRCRTCHYRYPLPSRPGVAK